MLTRRFFLNVLMATWTVTFASMKVLYADPSDVLLTLVQPQPENDSVIQSGITRQSLLDLPQASFETTTIWTRGVQEFEGVWLYDFLQSFKVTDGTLELEAINDYFVEIPLNEIEKGQALLAHTRNGKPMSAREKGPVWLVYNYDSDPAFRTETVYSRSVWQLDRITVSR
ncbi:oxidoreductase [uncultured Roseovarius sp.]|uniref:oxidoreductase n=1 Tax=uncultured Roseovarius sp. TaxID=293344 RepID=UPI0025F5969E|nr:oxidoreductase [uncultured Roseovarius sp.]